MVTYGIYQVTLFVQDMPKMVSFYRDVIRLTVNYPLKDDYSDEAWVTLQAGDIILALHHQGSDDYVAHAPQLCFRVDDIEAERERLIAAGVAVEAIIVVSPTTRFAMARDPENNKFSIDQTTR